MECPQFILLIKIRHTSCFCQRIASWTFKFQHLYLGLSRLKSQGNDDVLYFSLAFSFHLTTYLGSSSSLSRISMLKYSRSPKSSQRTRVKNRVTYQESGQNQRWQQRQDSILFCLIHTLCNSLQKRRKKKCNCLPILEIMQLFPKPQADKP